MFSVTIWKRFTTFDLICSTLELAAFLRLKHKIEAVVTQHLGWKQIVIPQASAPELRVFALLTILHDVSSRTPCRILPAFQLWQELRLYAMIMSQVGSTWIVYSSAGILISIENFVLQTPAILHHMFHKRVKTHKREAKIFSRVVVIRVRLIKHLVFKFFTVQFDAITASVNAEWSFCCPL